MDSKPLTQSEKKQLLISVFGEAHHSVGRNFPVFSNMLDKLGKFNDGIAIIELLPGINTLLTGPGVSSFLSHASFIGVILSPISNIISLINANQTGHRLYSYRCIAYTVTAWSFNKPIPAGSAKILSNIYSGKVVQERGTHIEFNKVWRETSINVVNKLNQISSTRGAPKKNMQAIYKAIGNGVPNELCLEILKSFESDISYMEKMVWQSLYNVGYGD